MTQQNLHGVRSLRKVTQIAQSQGADADGIPGETLPLLREQPFVEGRSAAA